MNDAGLFEATVPVFQHYLRRIERLLTTLPDGQEALLRERLSADAFCASEHLRTAVGLVSRTVFPLLDREVPATDDTSVDRAGLVGHVRETVTALETITPADFEGASLRVVRHAAGTAELDQDATTFVTIFALPNFFFHLSTAFAILRRGGMRIGKRDFDGQHAYAADFRF